MTSVNQVQSVERRGPIKFDDPNGDRGGKTNESRTAAARAVQELINQFDLNGDGKLNAQELADLTSMLKQAELVCGTDGTLNAQDLMKLINVADAGHPSPSGSDSHSDERGGGSDRSGGVGASKGAARGSGSSGDPGDVSAAGLGDLSGLDMASMDLNHDGVVDFQELMVAMGMTGTGNMTGTTDSRTGAGGGGGGVQGSSGADGGRTKGSGSGGGNGSVDAGGPRAAPSGSLKDAPGGAEPSGKAMDIRGTRGDNYHYQNAGGTETFRIGSGDKPAGERYDPRSEVALKADSFRKGEGTHTFSGDFQVKSGDNTTIAQIINHDPNALDKHVPSAFVTFDDGKLYQGNSKDGKVLAEVGDKKFNLSITSNGESYSIKVDGKEVGSFEAGRTSGENIFKYGAYHHGQGEANIGVSNVKVSHS
jgi:EF hand